MITMVIQNTCDARMVSYLRILGRRKNAGDRKVQDETDCEKELLINSGMGTFNQDSKVENNDISNKEHALKNESND